MEKTTVSSREPIRSGNPLWARSLLPALPLYASAALPFHRSGAEPVFMQWRPKLSFEDTQSSRAALSGDPVLATPSSAATPVPQPAHSREHPRQSEPSRGSGSSAAGVRRGTGRSARRTPGRPRLAPAPVSPRSPRQPPSPIPTTRAPETHRSTTAAPGV